MKDAAGALGATVSGLNLAIGVRESLPRDGHSNFGIRSGVWGACLVWLGTRPQEVRWELMVTGILKQGIKWLFLSVAACLAVVAALIRAFVADLAVSTLNFAKFGLSPTALSLP